DVSAVTATIDTGTATYPNCDETGEGLLRFENGAIGTLAGAWDDLANPLTYLVSGTEAHAAVINGQVYFQTNRKGESSSPQPLAERELPPAKPAGFESWLNAISGQSDQALVSAREAAYRSAVMEALYQGAVQQTWVTPERRF
ncbi:MAG TPA: hypothetical protein VLI90_15750, partial [Tepidisphaeraceae bacterium]|nr:hypothetical protein [Tepidisphaeraceae bacterium]